MEHQLIVILIFGVIAIFNWLVRKGASDERTSRQDSPPSVPIRDFRPRPIRPIQNEQERAREFMEALGLPAATEPPRRLTRSAAAATGSQKGMVQPGVSTVPPIAAAKIIRTAQSEPVGVPPGKMESVVSIVPAPLADGVVAPTDLPLPNGCDVQSMLKSTTGMRVAMVLKEILGPPRSLQPFSWTR